MRRLSEGPALARQRRPRLPLHGPARRRSGGPHPPLDVLDSFALGVFFGDGQRLLGELPSSALFARILQVSFIAAASLLPVLLYFLFDRYQLNTLRNRLYQDLFRLDRGLGTRIEIDTKYGSQIRETFGPEEQGRGRLSWP